MSALFLPIIFFCTISTAEQPTVCAFKALSAVSSPRYCEQIVDETKSRLEPQLPAFKFIAVGCVSIKEAKEV